MKSNLKTIICISAATVLTCSLQAEDAPKLKTDRDYSRDAANQDRRADRFNGAAKASDIIGMTVKNNQDERLGKVEDLAVDVESGRVTQVILSVGGIAGIGDHLTAVPPGALRHDVAQKVVRLDTTRDALKNAPKFEMTKWDEYSGTNYLSNVYRQYGQESSYTFIDRSEVREAKRERNEAPNTTAVRRPDGTWEKDKIDNDSVDRSLIPASRLSQTHKASKVIGTAVKNEQNEKLGKVENLLVDLTSGRIVAVVVSAGGFLGIGDELSAIPSSAFRFNTERDTLQLDATKETLASRPHFKANQWPDFSQPTYADNVYRSYGMQPYFSTNTIWQADNTARNVRDRNDQTLTPIDQGSSESDIQTTAQIRKEIMATKNISVSAQNVKIISNQGRVTLRGPVETLEEKRIIEDIAHRVASSATVDSQLEVKLVPTGRSQDGRKPQ